MIYKYYEQELPGNIYSNQLEDRTAVENYRDTQTFKYVMNSGNPEIKAIGELFFKNYMYIKNNYNRINKEKRCSDLNNWLDEKKDKYNIEHVHGNQWELIDNLRVKIENDRLYNKKCPRVNTDKSLIYRRKRIELDRYCENRDYLKNKCQNVSVLTRPDNENCLNLSEYVDKYYNIFLRKYPCIEVNIEKDEDPYHISDDCTLYDRSTTFPIYIFNNNDIQIKANSREIINKCISDPAFEASPEARYKGDSEMSEEQVPYSHFKLVDYVTYISSTVCGIFILFFSLYKFTPLGSWLHNRRAMEREIRLNMEEKETQELLDNSLEYMTSSSNKEGYYLTYQPVIK
ncbi:PIR protein [Plasmodium ovale]|uniref:PIR protein n=1 Tax=Plasmodium ovale TaxID=36330 RepID=A0A1D3JBS1_PLAOA|nr:PIR protein [Plasmodium ovale]